MLIFPENALDLIILHLYIVKIRYAYFPENCIILFPENQNEIIILPTKFCNMEIENKKRNKKTSDFSRKIFFFVSETRD